MLLQKICKLIGTEIGENQFPGNKSRRKCLAGNGHEFIKGSTVPADLDALVLVAAIVQVLFGHHAPGAAGFDV